MIPFPLLCPLPVNLQSYPTLFSDWDELLNFLIKRQARTLSRFKGTNIPNVDCFTAKNFQNEFVLLKYTVYYKENDHWFEETQNLKVSLEKVPKNILDKIKETEEEVDITDEIESEFAAKSTAATE